MDVMLYWLSGCTQIDGKVIKCGMFIHTDGLGQIVL